ncbi:TolC family outer membrane protein [Endozoicomonas sp. ALD040]
MKPVLRTTLTVLGMLWCNTNWAQSLEQTINDAIQTNPDMAVTLQSYFASQAELDIAQGRFLPSLDLRADSGREDQDRANVGETNQTRKQARLKLSIPLFRGFANTSEYSRADFNMQAHYHQTLAQAESLALQVAQVYTHVMNAQEVLRLSQENLEQHLETYDMVAARKRQGISDKSDLTQIKGRIARVRANILAARNNLADAETLYKQLTGDYPGDFIRPEVDQSYLPESQDRAIKLALQNNQLLIASRLDVNASTADVKGVQSENYPSFDLVADRSWKDNVSGFDGREDESRLLVEMNWNLYSGGQSSSRYRRALYREEASRMRSNKVYREVQANAESSWDAFVTLKQSRVHLHDYVEQSRESTELYLAQFKAGHRTLLDLLDTQNELFEARKQYLAADYQYVYAQYRVLASISNILGAMRINTIRPLLQKGPKKTTP